MKIRVRLTFLYTSLLISILLLLAVVVYWSAWNNRESAYAAVLKKEGITKANLILQAGLPDSVLHTIYKNNRQTLDEIEVAIYDSKYQLVYHDAVEIDVVKETPEMLQSIQVNRELQTESGNWQVLGFTWIYDNKIYIITSAGFDSYGWTKLKHLRLTFLWLFIPALFLVVLASYYFVKKALDPIKSMVLQANEMSAKDLSKRLPTGRHKDELFELSTTINHLLEKINQSFKEQKNFVNHVAHELRTPLAVMKIQVDLLLKENASDNISKQVLLLSNDLKRMQHVLDQLLNLAKAGYDPASIQMNYLRIDELIMEARRELIAANANYHINIGFQDVEDDLEWPLFLGNAYLIRLALINLMDNACKFSSPHVVQVSIKFSSTFIEVWISDRGIGIKKEDVERVKQPFYRGAQISGVKGFGIGLSLVQRIFEIHRIAWNLDSLEGKGTTVYIKFEMFN